VEPSERQLASRRAPTPEEVRWDRGRRDWLKGVVGGVLVIVAFLVATNHWYGWDEGIQVTHALDTETYASIAAAAPGLPNHDIGSAFTERFASPWILGSVGALLGGGSHTPFRVMGALSMILTLGLLVDICRRLRLGVPETLLCVGLLALNPYVFRGDALAPGPVDDAFVLGIAIVMWGLVAVRFAGVLAGAVVAILGRQTALLAIPAAAVWIYAGTGWRSRPSRERLLRAALPVALVLVLYGAIKLAVASFTYAFAPSLPSDTILPVIGHPGSLSKLGTHASRVALPLALWAASVAAVFVGLARVRERPKLSVEFWCALLIGASIVVQPLAISPHFRGFESNEQRLSALGLFPLCVCLAYLLRDAAVSLRTAPAWALGGGAVALLVASLHERFTTIGPETKAQFVTIELLAALVLGFLVASAIRARDRAGLAASDQRG
jgi:hypothetical protein